MTPLQLATLSGCGQLEVHAAASNERMSAAHGSPIAITSAYRTRAQQGTLYSGWVNHFPGYNFALPPDESKHVEGLAIDTPDHAWVKAHGEPFGWFGVTGEDWHFEYRIDRDQHIPTNLPPTLIPKDDDMIPLIQMFYSAYLNRTPSGLELLYWFHQLDGRSHAEAETIFKGATAEAGTVVNAYREFLKRTPSASDIGFWTKGKTIGQVWTGVASSPEAQGKV